MARTPPILQAQVTECCIAVPAQLRQPTGMSRHCLHAGDIARHHGLQGHLPGKEPAHWRRPACR